LTIVYILLYCIHLDQGGKREHRGVRNRTDTWSLIEALEHSEEQIRELARETGFQKRAPRKIDPVVFAQVLHQQSLTGACSYNDLALRIDEECGGGVSRQAVGKRMHEECVSFLEAILERALRLRLAGTEEAWIGARGKYKRVLVQDSTVVRLPVRLFEMYSGVANAHTKVCNARIQVVYDLIAGAFVSFTLDPYSKNDQTAAPELELQPGDLVLRDRGYLQCDEIQRHVDAGANCIYRHKGKTTYLDPETGGPIDLLDTLRRQGHIDREVHLNNDSQTPVRLVAVPVAEEVANLRRMKLKREARGHAPSAQLLELMSWTIFITTIPREEASFSQLLDIYGLRWRIETIFKAWKSNLKLDCIHNVSACQLKALTTARMTVIVLCVNIVYHNVRRRITEQYGKQLSLMKATKYLAADIDRIAVVVEALRTTSGKHPLLDRMARYCTYDKRNRENFDQKWQRHLDEWKLS